MPPQDRKSPHKIYVLCQYLASPQNISAKADYSCAKSWDGVRMLYYAGLNFTLPQPTPNTTAGF